MSTINQASSTHHTSGVAIDTYCSPEFICKLHDVAKCIPQLKKTGENFSIWEKQLKVMLRILTGSSDYFLHESHKHDPKLNEAVFGLIFWSIDEELQQEFIIDGSAGDAFQLLAGRFQSNTSPQSIINRADFPEEILDNIVNMVHHQSLDEHESINKRKMERISRTPKEGLSYEVYLGHGGPPVLTTFQNLAVVNRKFYRLCRPKLWQKIVFPTSAPAPLSLWTDDLLLKHSHSVKSAQFELEDLHVPWDRSRFSETERSLYDNTSPLPAHFPRYSIGLMSITKIFKLCPSIESVSLSLPGFLPPSQDVSEWLFRVAMPLKLALQLLPQLQHFTFTNNRPRDISGNLLIDIIKILPSLISLELSHLEFPQKEKEEDSFGWNLAQLQQLRKLSLQSILCKDQTWTLKSWVSRLETFDLIFCEGMTPSTAHELLSGNTPFLTRLGIDLGDFRGRSDINVRFDIPALQNLHVENYESPDLLVHFENCKGIERLQYSGSLFKEHRDSMKNLLSRRAWPKLSLLDIRFSYDEISRRVGSKELEEFTKPFNIKVLSRKN